ncbi:hypothetical protein BH11BAC2_BH11BAC2_05690 [soil metagenome]
MSSIKTSYSLKCIFVLLCLVILTGTGKAQQFIFQTENSEEKEIVDRLYAEFTKLPPPRDAVAMARILREQTVSLVEQGYLAASADSTSQKDSTITVYWTIGNNYRIAELRTNPIDEGLLSSAGVRDKLYRKRTFTPELYSKLMAKILSWCSNNGYPFALVKLDSVLIDESKISAYLLVDKGPLILLDTLQIKGDVKLSTAYLANYLSVKAGSPFNEQIIRRMSSRLKELPFVSEARTAQVDYFPGLARPVLFLQPKKASQFNGIIGIQPDNQNSGKTHITGDIKLRLHNSFGKAELFDLNWSNPLPKTQDLKIKMSYPFLFNTPFGLDLDLSLYKKDTVYLEFNRQIGIRYYLKGNNSFRAYFGRKSSDLISVKGYQNITTLPPFADVTANIFGLGLQLEHLDYRLNPRKGYSIDVSTGAGLRNIKKNASLNEVVYDSLDLNSTQYKAEFMGDVYFPIALRNVINLGLMSGFIQSPDIFENELYRLGGLKSLRGFDEGSLLASTYVMAKAEFRFILEQNSYLLLFFNQAYLEDKSKSPLNRDTPYGFGAGITFETKLGIFSFNYALGSQQDLPIEFRSAKVHFGLLNYF